MAEKPLPDYSALKERVRKLAKGPAHKQAVEARLKELSQKGIPRNRIEPDTIIAQRQAILDRVQERAEEYEQVSQSCAKASALSLMEEFGFGDMNAVTALSSFPGIALTGETCGAITGSMAALSLYFGRPDPLDFSANARAYAKSRRLIHLFEQVMGTTTCNEIHKNVIFGRYHDISDIKEGYPAFLNDKGFEKCGLPPGIAARLSAQIIIEDMEKKKQ